MKRKKRIDETFQLSGNSFKQINLLGMIFVFAIIFLNLIAALIQKKSIIIFLKSFYFWGLFPFFVILLIFHFSTRYKKVIKLTHILIFLFASFLDIQSDFDSIFGLLFWLMAVVIAYHYQFFRSHKILKGSLFCLFLFANVQTSAYREGLYLPGLFVLVVFLYFLTIIYIAYRNELDKIFHQEIRLKNENARLIQEKEELQIRMEQDKKRMEELEKYYNDYIESRKPFDLEEAGISEENIELIRTLVTENKSYSDLADELGRSPNAVRQKIFRINNKIGVDSLDQLKQLCQFNWPESAGRY